MAVPYEPSASVVREHLEHIRATASEPSWRRGDASLELLLGLRNPRSMLSSWQLRPDLEAMQGTGPLMPPSCKVDWQGLRADVA